MDKKERAKYRLERNKYRNCNLCESFTLLAGYYAGEEKTSLEIEECIKEVDEISHGVSICSRMCHADTLFRLACSLKRSTLKTRSTYLKMILLNIKSYLITRQLIIPNRYAVDNCIMIFNTINEGNWSKFEPHSKKIFLVRFLMLILNFIRDQSVSFFIYEALILAKRNRDYKTMTNLLIDFFDNKYIEKHFAHYVKIKKRKGDNVKNLRMLYDKRNEGKDDFSLCVLRQIKTTDCQTAVISIKKIPKLIDKITEMLFDSFLDSSSKLSKVVL